MARPTFAVRGAVKRRDVAPRVGLGHAGVRSKPARPANSPTPTGLVTAKSDALAAVDGLRHASYATTRTRQAGSDVSGTAHAKVPVFGTPRAITVGYDAPPSVESRRFTESTP